MSTRTHPLHDLVLDHADALMDVAESAMAEAVAIGDLERANRWATLAQSVAEGVRAVRPVLHQAAP